MKNLLTLLISILLVSCSNSNCVGDITGTYSGTCTSSVATFEGTMNIFEGPEGGPDVFIEDGLTLGGISGFEGELSGNCKNISIPSQSVINVNGASLLINGSININGSSLTGEIILDNGVA